MNKSQWNTDVYRQTGAENGEGVVDGESGNIPTRRGAIAAINGHRDHPHEGDTVARVVLPLLETATGHRHVGLCRETCGGKDKGYQDVLFHNGKCVIRYVCCG